LTSIFLGVPSVYKIKYIYGGKKEDAGTPKNIEVKHLYF